MMSDYDEALFAAKSFVAREFELLAKELSALHCDSFSTQVAITAVANVLDKRVNQLNAHLCTLADQDAAERLRQAERNGEWAGRDLER